LAQRAGHDFFNGYSTVITAVLFNLFLSEIAHDGQLELRSLVSFVHEQYPQDEQGNVKEEIDDPADDGDKNEDKNKHEENYKGGNRLDSVKTDKFIFLFYYRNISPVTQVNR
jgi:hypothetical protein